MAWTEPENVADPAAAEPVQGVDPGTPEALKNPAVDTDTTDDTATPAPDNDGDGTVLHTTGLLDHFEVLTGGEDEDGNPDKVVVSATGTKVPAEHLDTVREAAERSGVTLRDAD